MDRRSVRQQLLLKQNEVELLFYLLYVYIHDNDTSLISPMSYNDERMSFLNEVSLNVETQMYLFL